MRDGKYQPGEAGLRMKQDLDDPNPQMWDLFAYRVLGEEEAHHYRTGDKWKIYPTYDFAHCLCDSLEGITHSLCTTEFELSRTSYNWLCDKLEIYRPMQREYGRLNVSGTVLSKRKIVQLVKGNYVRDWDDPRLYTIIAIRRRGIPPRAILNFVNELGVTKAKTNIQVTRLEQTVRRYLEVKVPRLMLVLEPLKVVIDELPDDYVEMVDVPFGKDESFGVSARSWQQDERQLTRSLDPHRSFCQDALHREERFQRGGLAGLLPPCARQVRWAVPCSVPHRCHFVRQGPRDRRCYLCPRQAREARRGRQG